jgi:hypothetical protein
MSSKRSSIFVVLFALLLVAMVPAIAQAETHEGMIKSVDATTGDLVLTVDGADKNFKVDDTAEITVDGAEAKLADLAAGQSATVTAELKDGVMKVSKVEATKSK